MTAAKWTPADIPDLTGRVAVITGPSLGGIGYFTALELARKGAHVILAGRSQAKLDESAAAIRREAPAAQLTATTLDLTSFESVRRAAGELAALGPIDLLLNNAGIMATPHGRTKDGLEQQIGTNHYGPFLLTGLLFPQLEAAPAGRVVTVASLAHTLVRTPPLDDPRADIPGYHRWPTYGRSKLANLLFTYELDRRLSAKGSTVTALAAHPGFAHTHIVANGKTFGPLSRMLNKSYRIMAQDAAGGARPTLMAATAQLPGGTYVGPGGPAEIAGAPRIVRSTRLSHDTDAAARLWSLSEEVTCLAWP
ncbi:oxidoreductase [Nocardioides sp. Kera G14]|uniref:oxidoreductase n=1 Tax=Nocardioides sp. Kera G14 TaxID=2884264 RepID=UPI001D102408|nr:oxidoreductase [Nocardioides sp. Kera G14]UDY23246.1 SDR family NAD(P)-dependent oxidoreductase [Nocardioides sp. Kera G14]